MGGSPVLVGWDTFILAVPVIGILVMAMFGLDERLFTPRRNPGTRRFFCEVSGKGSSFLSDPDGKPWRKGVVRPLTGRGASNCCRARKSETGVSREFQAYII